MALVKARLPAGSARTDTYMKGLGESAEENTLRGMAINSSMGWDETSHEIYVRGFGKRIKRVVKLYGVVDKCCFL